MKNRISLKQKTQPTLKHNKILKKVKSIFIKNDLTILVRPYYS